MKKTPILLCALLCGLSASAFAAQTFTISLDAASAGPGKFAAEEIRREAAAKGMTMSDAANAHRISITADMDGKAAIPRPIL